MDKKILLTIIGSHRGVDGENSTIELITEGRLFRKDGIYYIEYEESEISGKRGTKTLISIDDNMISMERSGTSTSQLFFERGKCYINNFITPFGAMQMEIYPTRVKYDLNDEEGRLDLKYQMAIDGRTAGTNEITFLYK
ncbi:MAG: DUF1934 domain-containing protein [Caldicoprobacterales bacterium]|jgi:uncharacterized beta-barrel protein YwiB (DUF1934 family)|nr:DUF1934 domain-containing protein [Clostridiales bacterium]